MANFGLNLLFALCRLLSWPLGALHALLAETRIVRLSVAIAHTRRSRVQVLADCWFAKGVREMVPFLMRTRLREELVRRVRLGSAAMIPGCVFAVIHSSWTQWLCRACRERELGLVLVRDGRSPHLGSAAVGSDFVGLRRMVAHLRGGGRLFAAMDVFPEGSGSPVRFMGERRQASLLPARLAAAAGVLIIPTIPAWREGRLDFELGPFLRVDADCDPHEATQMLLGFLERRILDEPCAWNESVRGCVGLAVSSEPRGEEPTIDADRLASHESGRG